MFRAAGCRYMPDAKEWLDRQIREAWTKGMQDRCKMHEALRERQDVILPALADECDALTARHAHRCTDSRSQTHMQVRSQGRYPPKDVAQLHEQAMQSSFPSMP